MHTSDTATVGGSYATSKLFNVDEYSAHKIYAHESTI